MHSPTRYPAANPGPHNSRQILPPPLHTNRATTAPGRPSPRQPGIRHRHLCRPRGQTTRPRPARNYPHDLITIIRTISIRRTKHAITRNRHRTTKAVHINIRITSELVHPVRDTEQSPPTLSPFQYCAIHASNRSGPAAPTTRKCRPQRPKPTPLRKTADDYPTAGHVAAYPAYPRAVCPKPRTPPAPHQPLRSRHTAQFRNATGPDSHKESPDRFVPTRYLPHRRNVLYEACCFLPLGPLEAPGQSKYGNASPAALLLRTAIKNPDGTLPSGSFFV